MGLYQGFSASLQSHSLTKDDSGFSLIEALVAAVLLSIAAASAFTLFTTSEALFSRGRLKDSQQTAINRDLAEIGKYNRRYSCYTGSCDFIEDISTLSRANSSLDPNENEYTPQHPGGDTAGTQFEVEMTEFTNACNNTNASNGASLLVNQFIQDLGQKLSSDNSLNLNLSRQQIDRTVVLAQDSVSSPHAYSVIYKDSRNGIVLRRARLTPTVAGWCP